eukprot:5203877-Pleurochrysis_carterae.AAC.1
MTAAEKTKKVLSANPKAPISIECFMDDIDVKGMMERDVFLQASESDHRDIRVLTSAAVFEALL